jgi:hypothetical protein
MAIKEFTFSESLRSKGVTNLFLKDNEIVVEINDKTIKTMLDFDFLTTINNIRNNLGDFTKDNKIKEELIFTISKNLKQTYELENDKESSNETSCEENITLDEWKTTLVLHYSELKKLRKKIFQTFGIHWSLSLPLETFSILAIAPFRSPE